MSIREVALSKKGTFATLEYSRPVKVKKGCPVEITKTTVARNVRIGAQYDAMKSVQLAKGVTNTADISRLRLPADLKDNFPSAKRLDAICRHSSEGEGIDEDIRVDAVSKMYRILVFAEYFLHPDQFSI